MFFLQEFAHNNTKPTNREGEKNIIWAYKSVSNQRSCFNVFSGGLVFWGVVLKGYISYLCPNILNDFIRIIDIQTHQSVEKFDICSYIFWKTWLSKQLVDKEPFADAKITEILEFFAQENFLIQRKEIPFGQRKIFILINHVFGAI